MDKPVSGLQRRANILATAKAIDEVATGAMELFSQAGSFEHELGIAHAMQDLRTMLSPEVMAPIMSLMNTRLGFQTDRDPKRPGENGRSTEPYSVDVVRDVVIEARLRGFHTVGNEFNIISGGFYAAKNGFRRKLTDGKTFKGLSDFRDSYDVPRNVADKGAIVRCRAEWKLNGTLQTLEAEIPVKVNAYMGTDAVLGKAERKLLKRVHDRLAGVNTPDAEAGEEPVPATPPQREPAPQLRMAPRPAPEPEGPDDVPMGSSTPSAAPGGSGGAVAEPGTTTAEPARPEGVAADGGEDDPRARLIASQLKRAGIAPADALRTLHRMFPESSGCANLSQISKAFPNVINSVLRQWDAFRRSMQADIDAASKRALEAKPANAEAVQRELDAEAEGIVLSRPSAPPTSPQP